MKDQYFLILCSTILPLTTYSTTFSYNSMQIKDLKITKCSNLNYPVSVNNVTIQLNTNKHVKVSGSLMSEIDLVGPIKASVTLKRNIWGVWVHVPCENKVGSCTYDNLCVYGYPDNVNCPEIFVKNNVPCRCPIQKGNYTILPTADFLFSQENSILAGKYYADVSITQSGEFLACYDIYFTLYDQVDEYSVILV